MLFGIITGKFENISQAQTAIKTGGLMDTLSEGLNLAINQANKNGILDDTQTMLLRKGKNAILSTIESNIEDNFFSQQKSLEFLGKYENNWKYYYKNKDFTGMEREYNKIKSTLKTLLPIEETINQAKQIENLHLLIKNNGQNFNISGEELALAKKLVM